ncbi:MAG: DUF4965 domain-containing protein [Clostridia bacterium]|nr:DUF4965 domain-containing protein [Clostridia bacterium]
MNQFDRVPAIPLIANDPYFSVWLPGDLPTDANTVHWGGAPKWIRGHAVIDGVQYRFLGKNGVRIMKTTAVRITPTRTIFEYETAGVAMTLTFWSPALPDDPDVLSTPITFVDFACRSTDGNTHDVQLCLMAPKSLCYDGANMPELMTDIFCAGGMKIACIGQKNQKLLCHSGDRITIDWGYLYAACEQDVEMMRDFAALKVRLHLEDETQTTSMMLAYDDVASINYFGVPCRAWYARGGRTIMDAMLSFAENRQALLGRCIALDEHLCEKALAVGGEDYRQVVSAAWRHTFAAHKLIATPGGDMALLSKENDSNGCIGTVDLSYPSSPVFLLFAPELVNAMCRPVLEFSAMPCWGKDFAPHDVGRYPHVHGQVYALKQYLPCGHVYPPHYLYPASADLYNDHNQMPVEESGNMLVMLASAIHYGADDSLARAYMPTLDKWVRYLDRYGEDPGEQLCTDDFAGHLARNVNLSAKAIVGVACYARLLSHFGRKDEAAKWTARAREMAESWLTRADRPEGSVLTFDGKGWSMKYNLVWDRLLDLDLLSSEFYARETASYLPRINEYGLPLDSRADYSKSDWIAWVAAMAPDKDVRRKLLAPLGHYLRHSMTRVAFSDWYDTVTGDYVEFIARSVQGGLYMPLLFDSEGK